MSRGPEKAFFQRRNILTDRHMKKCSIFIIIREMQVKTIVRHHLTPVRMAIIKKNK